jgi:hypothetical protein
VGEWIQTNTWHMYLIPAEYFPFFQDFILELPPFALQFAAMTDFLKFYNKNWAQL